MNRSWRFLYLCPRIFFFIDLARPQIHDRPIRRLAGYYFYRTGPGRVSAEHYQKTADFVKMAPGFDQRALNTKYEK